MARTLHRLSEEAMRELAEKLINMPFRKACGHTRRLDPDSQLQMWRLEVGHEMWTRYRLPNLGVAVTLVEEDHEEPIRDGQKLRFEPRFVEARVEPLE